MPAFTQLRDQFVPTPGAMVRAVNENKDAHDDLTSGEQKYDAASVSIRLKKLHKVANFVERNRLRRRRLFIFPVRFSHLEREFPVAFAQLFELTGLTFPSS